MKIGFSPFGQSSAYPLISTLFSGIKTAAKVALCALAVLPLTSALPMKFPPYIKQFPLLGIQLSHEGSYACPFYKPGVRCERVANRALFAGYNNAIDALQNHEVPTTSSTFINRLWLVARALSGRDINSYRSREMMIPIGPSNSLSSEEHKVYDGLIRRQSTLVSIDEVSQLRNLCSQMGMFQTVHPAAINKEVERLADEYEEAVGTRVDPVDIAAKVQTRLLKIAPFDQPVRTDMLAQIFTNVVLSGIGHSVSVVYPDSEKYRTIIHKAVQDNNSTHFAFYLRTAVIPWVQKYQSQLPGH